MDRETAKDRIKTGISCLEFLEKAKEGQYCCPFCNTGRKDKGTGGLAYYKKTNTFYCFACQTGGDVIKLYQQTTGTDYNTALSELAQRLGITIDPYRVPASADFGGREKAPQTAENSPKIAEKTETPAAEQTAEEQPKTANYSAYYKACKKRLNDPAAVEYLKGRGISMGTAEAYYLGYDPAADPASAPGAMGEEYKPHPCPRIIIPTCNGHYVARSMDENALRYVNPNIKKGAAAPAIFNAHILYKQDVQEVFVTEGAFDALSIIEVGAAAISLNSTANADLLIKQLEQRRTAATLILCLDNDSSGQKATATIREGLQRLNISFICADICAGHKDPNEALTADREAFIAAVMREKRRSTAPDNTSYYIDSLMTAEIERFRSDKSTGFAELDKNAGGLYSGLYVLAAISSLGKTSFALQLADQIAGGGHDVLFFSLEQSRLELVSKSLARITAQNDPKTAVTSLAIRKGNLPPQVLKAAEAYKKAVSDRLSVIEGNFVCNVSFIGDYIRQYVQRNEARPVVFIDYLQILQPEQEGGRRQTTKETVDSTVTELKRLSRELDLTIFIISSVNRANYLTPIDFESLKESGGIEFTADCIWGLQLQCLNDPIFDKANNIKERREKIKEEKAKTPRKIELVCLKNRYGIANYSVCFDYFPANDLFTECSTAEAEFASYPKTGKKKK